MVDEDSRGTLEDMQEELGLTDEAANQIAATVGVVACPDAENDSKEAGNGKGYLIKNNMTLLTAAHVFYGKRGHLKPDCWFALQSNIENKYYINYDTLAVGSDIYGLEKDRDYAVALLDRPVTGAVPFPMYAPPDAVDKSFISVSATHGDRRFDSFDQIAQECAVRDQFDYGSQEYRVDCDMYGGGSGGPLLMHFKGRMVASAVTVRSMVDGTGPYDTWYNSSAALAYGGEMKSYIDEVIGHLDKDTPGLVFTEPLFK